MRNELRGDFLRERGFERELVVELVILTDNPEMSLIGRAEMLGVGGASTEAELSPTRSTGAMN